MKSKNSLIQKYISALLIIAILTPALFIFSIPQKTYAQSNVPVADFKAETSLGTIAKNTPVIQTQTTTNTLTTLKSWALTILQQTLMMVAKAFLAKLTQATINWINSDFHGSPLFVENPGSFFGDIAKSEIKTLVDLYGLDPNRFPFGKDFALNIIASYKRQLADNTQYTLSNVIKDATLLNNYRNDFNVGGWNGFLINTQYPQNNYLGFNMLASEELARKLQGTVQNAAQKVQTALQQGMGFLSPQTCPTNPAYNNGINEFQRPSFQSTVPYAPPTWTSGDGYPDQQSQNDAYEAQFKSNEATQKSNWAITNTCPGGLVSTTPGSVAANQIMTAMSSTYRQSELASALGNSLSAILDALMNHFLDKGLDALSSTVSSAPSLDNWSYNGQTLNGGTTSGSTITGGAPALNIPQNVSVTALQTTSTAISGGTGPYWIPTLPDATKATARIDTSGSAGPILTVTGKAPGQTSFIVSDSSSPTQALTIQITVNAAGALTVIPANILTGLSNPFIATISGGTGPYSIVTGPDESVAIASFSDSSIVVTGISSGTTSVKFADSSTPANTITVPIVIQGPQDLAVTPNNLLINTLNTKNNIIAISGGKAPYFVQSVLDPTIAKAEILPATPTTLTVTGLSNGPTPVIITDSSQPANITTVNITVATQPLGNCTNISSRGTALPNQQQISQTQCSSLGGQWTQNQNQ